MKKRKVESGKQVASQPSFAETLERLQNETENGGKQNLRAY